MLKRADNRAGSGLSADVRMMNKNLEARLQKKLQHINFRYRVASAALYDETLVIIKEHTKLLHLKGSEPRATADNTMKEIREKKKGIYNSPCSLAEEFKRQSNVNFSPRTHYSQNGKSSLRWQQPWSAYSLKMDSRLEPCLISAEGIFSSYINSGGRLSLMTCPAPRPKSTASLPVRLESNSPETGTHVFSLNQLKHIATIDNITKKELERQEELQRQEKKRLKLLVQASMSQKIEAFLSKLNHEDKKAKRSDDPWE